MKTDRFWKLLRWLVPLLVLPACTSVSVRQYTMGEPPPLCHGDAPPQRLLVFWGTAWRSDQKEVARRDRIAARQLANFFRQSPC